MKRIFAAFLSATLCLSLCIPICATENPFSHANERVVNLAQEKMESIAKADSTACPNILTTKKLVDFAGNSYTLFEYSPTGYSIYSDATGVFVETSSESPSPYAKYANFVDDLFYGGPLCYFFFSKEDGCYVHTILGEKVYSIPKLAQRSSKLHTALIESRDEKALGFVQNEGAMQESYSTRAIRYVDNYTYIRNLQSGTEMGYAYDSVAGEGMCGWIASGIAILYLQLNSGARLIPTSPSYVSNNRFTGPAFTQLLRSYGNNSDTTGSDLAAAILSYADDKNYPLTATHYLTVSTSEMENIIDESIPVVAGGHIWDCQQNNPLQGVNHYIVIYGYDANEYICHYGWSNYSNVHFNRNAYVAIWGDMVKIELSY